jgi:hypothetical protein
VRRVDGGRPRLLQRRRAGADRETTVVGVRLPEQVQAGVPFLWMNPNADDDGDRPVGPDPTGAARVEEALAELPLERRDLEEARARWERLAPLLQRAFPETSGASAHPPVAEVPRTCSPRRDIPGRCLGVGRLSVGTRAPHCQGN